MNPLSYRVASRFLRKASVPRVLHDFLDEDEAEDAFEAFRGALKAVVSAMWDTCWDTVEWVPTRETTREGAWSGQVDGVGPVSNSWTLTAPRSVMGVSSTKAKLDRSLAKEVMRGYGLPRSLTKREVTEILGDREMQARLHKEMKYLFSSVADFPEVLVREAYRSEARAYEKVKENLYLDTETTALDTGELVEHAGGAEWELSLESPHSIVNHSTVGQGEITLAFQVEYRVVVDVFTPGGNRLT